MFMYCVGARRITYRQVGGSATVSLTAISRLL
jgi:hypothetical protein